MAKQEGLPQNEPSLKKVGMSPEELAKAKAEMGEFEYIGGKFVKRGSESHEKATKADDVREIEKLRKKVGESNEEKERRELLEEAGYNGDFQFVSQSLHYAYSTLIKFNFIALNCNKVQEPKTDKNEFTEVILMPLNEFKNHLRGGQLTDVETGYLGLDFLKLL